MKYLIAYKQSENDYVYVKNIGNTISKTTAYYDAIDFLTYEDAKNVCNFIKEYEKSNDYVIIKYTYKFEEIK